MNILAIIGWLLTSNWFVIVIMAFFYDCFSKER
jgi:hypothetical protein